MNLVIDASLTMAWYFEDESTPGDGQLWTAVDGWRRPGARTLAARSRQRAADGRSGAERIDAVYRDAVVGELILLPITHRHRHQQLRLVSDTTARREIRADGL